MSSQRYKKRRKKQGVKIDRLGEAVQSVKEYNENHGTRLTYGQYMIKKRNGEIT